MTTTKNENSENADVSQERSNVKKVSRRALLIFVALFIPFLVHLRLALGSWDFLVSFLSFDIVTWAILGFIMVLALIVYGTFIYFRKYF